MVNCIFVIRHQYFSSLSNYSIIAIMRTMGAASDHCNYLPFNRSMQRRSARQSMAGGGSGNTEILHREMRTRRLLHKPRLVPPTSPRLPVSQLVATISIISKPGRPLMKMTAFSNWLGTYVFLAVAAMVLLICDFLLCVC